MAIAVEMPKLSDTMEEGVVSAWMADEGDAVSSGDVIAQVETDKATMDLEVFDDGVLLKKVVDEGESVPLGKLIAVLGEEGEDISDLLAEHGEEAAGSDGAEAEASGAAEEEEVEVAATDREAEDAAPSKEERGRAKAEKDDNASSDGAAAASGDAAEEEEKAQPAAAQGENGRVKASPLARKLAGEHGIELSAVEGSGPQGRIVKRDIEAHLEKGAAEPVEEKEEAVPAGGDGRAYGLPGEVSPQEAGALYESEKISQMRKTIARRLGESKYTAPHFYLTVDISTAALEAFRKDLNALAEKQERARISLNDLITKACAVALRQHPEINTSYLENEGEIRYYNRVHVAVAVAIDEGLLTPVIRNADQKGLAQIAEETKALAKKARERKLQPEEFEGSTFTTSNLGMFGIEAFTAIINPPNACILAIGTIRDVPVVEDGEVVPGRRMKVTLSCDHRVVDGAKGAEFLATLKGLLEDPLGLLL